MTRCTAIARKIHVAHVAKVRAGSAVSNAVTSLRAMSLRAMSLRAMSICLVFSANIINGSAAFAQAHIVSSKPSNASNAQKEQKEQKAQELERLRAFTQQAAAKTAAGNANARSGGTGASGDSSNVSLVESYLTLAKLSEITDPRQQINYALRARTLASTIGYSKGIAKALYQMGIGYRFVDEYDSADACQRSAYAAFEALGDQKGMSLTLGALGSIDLSRGKYGTALERLVQARHLAQMENDTTLESSALANIGVVYRYEENFPLSLQYQHESLRLRRLQNDKRNIAFSLYNIANVYRDDAQLLQMTYTKQASRLKQLCDSAVLCYIESEQLFMQSNDSYGVALNLTGLGGANIVLGKYDEAQQSLTRAEDILQKLGDKRGVARVDVVKAELYIARKDLASALQAAQRGLSTALGIGALNEAKTAYKLLSDIYTTQGKTAQAFAEFKRYAALRDSLLTDENRHNVAAIQTRFETNRKNQEIAVLKRDQEFSRLRSQAWMMMLAAVLVAMIAITILAVNRSRAKTKAAALLQEQNNRILDQQHQLEAQAEEIRWANTELQRSNGVLESKNNQLRELDTEKNELLGIVAHDLKNPLTSIKMLAKVLHDEADTLPPADVREFATDVRNSTERMFDLISSLLDINALERGGMNFTIESVAVEPVVEAVLAHYAPRATQKSIALRFVPCSPSSNGATHSAHSTQSAQSSQINHSTALIAQTDAKALRQILDNLVSNAVKYSPTDTTVTVATGHTRDAAGSSTVFIRVEDEGPGINAEDKQRLFGKFARLSARPTAGEDSTGLGLSIVKKMADAMHGAVWCESEPERGLRGAAFVLALPSESRAAEQGLT
jgi:signal transduction histidine kinase